MGVGAVVASSITEISTTARETYFSSLTGQEIARDLVGIRRGEPASSSSTQCTWFLSHRRR